MQTRRTALIVGCVACCLGLSPVGAQKKGRPKKPVNTRQLDLKAEKLQEEFLRDAATIAKQYEDAGELEKARGILKAVLRLDSSLAGAKSKLKEIDEALMSRNEVDFELDTDNGWTKTPVRVFKGKEIRIQANGEYRVTSTLTLGPSGVSTDDPTKDMAAGVPLGRLIGMVVLPTTGAKGVPKLERGRPFVVGNGVEYTPKQDGFLFLRVNVPPGSKCTGRIRIHISGNVRKG